MLKGKNKIEKLSHIEQQLKLFIGSLTNRSIETIGTYERSLREFANWNNKGKNKKIDFQQDDVESYMKYLKIKKKLSHFSLRTYLTALRQFFNYLLNNGILLENAALKVKATTNGKSQKRKTLNEKEILQYLKSIQRNDERGYRDYAISKLILSSGLQEIELVRANIGDYKNINHKSILFVQGKGKKNKNDSIEITGEAKKSLEDYLAFRRYALDYEPLFMSAGNRTRGKRMTSRGIRERINMYFKIAGIKKSNKLKLSPSALRQSAAKIFVSNGMPPSELQKLFRIGKLKTALMYYPKS